MAGGIMSMMPAPGTMRNLSQAQKPADPDENNKIMLQYIDKEMKGEGFVNWKPFNHPSLGKCEIGGFAPYFPSTPPAGLIDSLCSVQLPWLLRLSSKLPDISFLKEKVTDLGAGVYKLELFFENKGILPYPVAMGTRNRQPAPVMITLAGEGIEFLEGFSRAPLGEIGGNQIKKLTPAGKKQLITTYRPGKTRSASGQPVTHPFLSSEGSGK